MQRRWLAPSLVGLWLAGCGFFGFPEPERAPDGDGGSSPGGTTSGSSGSGAGDPATGGNGGADKGGNAGTTSGAAGDGEGGGAGTSEGGTAGTPTGGTGGRPTGGSAGIPTGGSAGDGGSSGEGPTLPVTSDLSIWLDANDVAGQGAPISTWTNRADVESDATQAVPAQRPTVTSVDGRNGVLFDGTRWMRFGEGFENFVLGLTFFVVAKVDVTGRCNELLQLSNGGEQQDISFQSDLMGVNPGVFLFEVADTNLTTDPGTVGGPDPVLVTVVVSPPSTASIFRNGLVGAMQTSDTRFVPEVIPRAENYLGSGLYMGCDPFEGVFFEVLLYNRALTTENIELVNA